MSRSAKWKLEKAKVKVVFRLQFHATHIPLSGWDKLFVSFIPADSGKATAKTSKASVRNGICKWADPIYETTRLLQDTKTRQYDEKLYKLVVAMGSSRSGLLGEANINLADYADASKPSTISLPLNGCNYGTVLQVTVQPLTSKTGFREFEQQRDLRERGTPDHNLNDESAESLSASTETGSDRIDKVNTRVRFKSEPRELPSLEEVAELNEDYADSAIGIDVSSNTSGSLYAEKQDSSTHELDSLKSTMSGSDHRHDKGDPSDHRLLAQGSNDWVHGWSSDYSMDNELATAYEENSRLRGSLDVAESSILELKLELSSLQSHATELGDKTQQFGEVLDAEIASGADLAKEVSVLKSECSKFRNDVEQLKHSRLSPDPTCRDNLDKGQLQLFQDLQMRWIQGLHVMEDRVRDVQDKACHRYHEGDLRFLHPDLELLENVLRDLREGTMRVMSSINLKPAELPDVKEIGSMCIHESGQFVPVDEGNLRPIQIFQVPNPVDVTIALEAKIGELHRELEESKVERENLTRKLDQMECYYEALIQELEESQKQMLGELQSLRNEHSNCLYTISSCKTQMETMHQDMNKQFLRFTEDRHDLESINKVLETRALTSELALKRARWNHSIAVGQLQKDLELLSFQVLSMFQTNDNLIRQAFTESSGFDEYLEENVEADDSCLQKDYATIQEQYSTRVQAIEDEVHMPPKTEQVLSSDRLVSLPSIEEKKIMAVHAGRMVKTHRDLNALDSLIVPEVELPSEEDKHKLDSQKTVVAELVECQNHNSELKKQLLSGEILFENLKRSLQLQVELYQNAEDELQRMHVENVRLDVFSKALEESLHESNHVIKIMEGKADELAGQLTHAAMSAEVMMYRLQAALNDVNTQREQNAISVTKCSELALQNQMLEKKLQGLFDENYLLTEKLSEFKGLLMECENYQSKYEICNSEKAEVTNLLKQQTLQKSSLQNEVSSLHDELKTLKADFDTQSSLKDNLEKTISFLQDKLGDLRSSMAMFDEQISGSLACRPVSEELNNENNRSMFSDLEHLQKKVYEKILKLIQEKKELEKQREIAQVSLSSKGSENLFMRQRYESDIQNMVNKLDMSMSHAQKLQLEIENISNKLKISSEAEERYADHIKETSSQLAILEANVQHVKKENTDFAQKVLMLENVNEELERTKLIVVDSTQENQAMMISLRTGNEEFIKLANELSKVKSDLDCVHVELDSERSLRIKLEGTVSDLSSQLTMKNDQLQLVDAHNEEHIHLKELISDFELEKSMHIDELVHMKKVVADQELEMSRVSCQLLHSEDSGKKADENILSLRLQLTDLQSHIDALLECLLAADIELISTRHQFQNRIQELVEGKENVEKQKDIAHVSLNSRESEILFMKRKYEFDIQDMVSRLNMSMGHMQKLQLEIENVSHKLKISSEAEERYAEQVKEMSLKLAVFEADVQLATKENTDLAREILILENVNEELEKTKLTVVGSTQENQAMMISLRADNAELASELSKVKDDLNCVHGELHTEKSLRTELEGTVSDLSSQLILKSDQLQSLDGQTEELVHLKKLISDLELEKSTDNAELVHLKKRVSDLELEKSRMYSQLLQNEEYRRKADNDISSLRLQLCELETHLASLLEYSLAADVELILTRNQFQDRVQELTAQLESLDGSYRELHLKHLELLTTLNGRMANDAQYADENLRLSVALNLLRSELEGLEIEKKSLIDRNNIMSCELEKHQTREAAEDIAENQEKHRHKVEIEDLKNMIFSSEEVIDNLISSQDELEIMSIVLRSKLDEQRPQILLLEEYANELMILRNQQKDLSQRLSEQILKTEEFKNLSIHLKELKDKADAECIQARERRDADSPSVAMQESLRIAFIKEQCETKLQEMRTQLYASKKHGEEMLLKLQDALTELENRKKTDVSQMRRNEELSLKILELEAELQAVLADKREKVNAYDRMKAELECSLISLDCCKEEKQKLEASLRECNEDKAKITVQLSSMEERLKICATPRNLQDEGSDKSIILEPMSKEPIKVDIPYQAKGASRVGTQDGVKSRNMLEISRKAAVDQEDLLQNNARDLAIIDEHVKAQSLMSSMEDLHKELERMKFENLNSLNPREDYCYQAVYPRLQQELSQLQKANEQLGNIFPLFNEFSSGGNALERVLALEMELAEALQAKRKSSIHFQSSFLKQHSDEEAIFKSFRDINELIKDMLEMKGRYGSVETELKEMHNRYSQLSLQFAEVEGERQKLVMKLKNTRVSKKSSCLYRSASDSLGDHS